LLFSTNLIFLIMSLVYLFRKQINKLVLILFEIIFILLSFIYLPLILAFSMYFCFFHSSKHIIGLARELDSQNIGNGLKLFVLKAIPLTLLTIILAFLSLYFLNNLYIRKHIFFIIRIRKITCLAMLNNFTRPSPFISYNWHTTG